jgi:hypothetical protein
MAEVWDSLKSVRIKLNDPTEVINLEHVADFSSLPASAVSQTAYRTDDSGEYYLFSGASYIKKDLFISDELLNEMISAYGETGAIRQAYTILMSRTLREMEIVRHSNGSESFEYQALSTQLDEYRKLRDAIQEDEAQAEGYGTGRTIRTCRPIIGAY